MKLTGSSLQKLSSTCVFALTGTALATSALAQDDSILEEIVVIAKDVGVVNVMDQPVAITAVTGAQIEDSAIKDMFDMQVNVPGLIVGQSQTATTSNFAIRGIGSTSNNFGVESSVGLYVDGVYRSRQSSLINELVDVEAVEVLRGPQGTLFGKNTASGAINVRTVAPSPDGVDGFIEATAGDYGLGRISAAANVPLTDKLAFRGTIFASRRDGYVADEVLGSDVYNDRDRIGLRAQVAYEGDNDFTARVIVDYAEIEEICCVALSRVDAFLAHDLILQGQAVPGPDAILAALGATVYTDFPYEQIIGPLPPSVISGVGFDDYRTATNKPPLSKNEDRGVSVELSKTFGNGLTLTSVTAFRAFDTLDDIDADFTNAAIVERINVAEQQSLSQELRLAGEFGGGGSWVVGGYFFDQDIKSNTRTTGGVHLQPYALIGNPALQQAVDGVNAVSALVIGMGGFFPPAADPFPSDIFAEDVVNQEHESFALFSQLNFNLGERLTATIGARFTDEKKDIDARYTQTNNGPPPDLNAIGLNLFLASQGMPFDPVPLLAIAQPNVGWGGYLFAPLAPRPDVLETLDDDQVTGTAKLAWDIGDTSMLYLSYSTGYKAGGTNADRIFPQFDQVFGPETSKSAEIGFKGDLTDRLRLNVAVFKTDYEDFQANSFTGAGFNLQNAGELETQGIEVELLWKPFDSVTVQSFFAHNEGEFTSFEGGTCWDATPFHTGTADIGLPPGADPDLSPCVRTGGKIPYNPEDRFFLGLRKDFQVGDNNLFIKAEYSYASELFTDGDLDPLTLQDDLSLVNVRIGMDIDAWNSSVSVWGRNITDERYYSGSFDPPLLDNGRMNSYPSEPATYGISFRKNWD